jgi:hypothetical protein
LQGLAQHSLGHVIVKNAFLGKGYQLQIEYRGEIHLHALQSFYTTQANEWINFDVRTHGSAAVTHGELAGTAGALVHVVHRKGFFQLGQ